MYPLDAWKLISVPINLSNFLKMTKFKKKRTDPEF